ncbi:cyclin-domain-containing protein [Syncephalis plumigaleata]|nr:cyclin-domain-containing protein [Syncephalis plumigaleata]
MLTWLLGQLSPVFGAAVTDYIPMSIQPEQPSRSQSSLDSNTTTTSSQSFVVIPAQISDKHYGAMPTEATMIMDSSSSLMSSLKDVDAVDNKISVTELPADFGEANPMMWLVLLVSSNMNARIVRYTSLETACLLCILVYIDRVCASHPTFTLASLTAHRFISAAVTVSAKTLCDVYCTNAHYAKVGGVSCAELNALELALLRMIDWRLYCRREELQRYYENLVQQHPGYRLAQKSKMADANCSPATVVTDTDTDTTNSSVSSPNTVTTN